MKGKEKFMRVFKLFFVGILLITACNPSQTDEIIQTNPYPNETTQEEVVYDEAIDFARENLDLQAVGGLLEESDDAEEFEYLLNNSENSVNNLDLNGDGYVDYISVREFDDRNDDERGFSLFSMFGPNEIQEIATIIFDRDGRNYPGARVLLTGNEQLYGDNYYQEANWRDRSLNIVSWLFGNRDDYYRSPYYYNNYPSYYDPYEVVDMPVYRTRIEEYYPNPVFVYTAQPTITNIKIVSPNYGRTTNKIYGKLAKPTKEQNEFRKNNRQKPQFVKVKNEKREKVPSKFENKRENKPNKSENSRREKNQTRNNSDRVQRENVKQNKPNKTERQNVRQNNPNKVERQNVKQNNPNKQTKPNNDGQNRGDGQGKGSGKKGKN